MLDLKNDKGPEKVFIFYSFLILDDECNNLTVFDKSSLRSTFVKTYRRLKRSHVHLDKKLFKKTFVDDLTRSYLYIKNKYFETKQGK